MHAESTMRKFRVLTFILPVLAIAGCGTGDGPESIPGTAATPLPDLPPGFCDPINFEIGCDLPPITNFASGVTEVIDNPDMSGINVSDRVARMQKFFNPVEFFGGSRLDFQAPLSFTGAGSFQAFTIKVWSSREVGLLLKAEENTDGSGGIGRVKGHTGSGMWEELCYEFAGATLDVIGITVIFDNGLPGAAGADPDNWTFFYDDITLVENCPPGPPTELPVDFENDPFDYDFGADAGFEGAFASVVTNPDQSGINTSSQVARMVKAAAASGLTFGGATLALDTPADVEAGSSFTMKVWATRQVPVLFQPEPQGPGSGVEVIHTGTGWEELTFSLPALAGTVSGITVIFDINVLGDFENNPDDWTFYFDDITLLPPGSGGGTAMGGEAPQNSLISADPAATPDFVEGTDFTGFTAFGSGSSFDTAFTGDSSYGNAVSVTTGPGYGGGILAQFGIEGFAAGFAGSFDNLVFKVKGLVDDTILVKIEEPFPGASALVTVELGSPPAGVTTEDLGDGWWQVVIPIANFNSGDVSTFSQLVFETVAGATTTDYTFYLTDIGFSNAGGTAMGGQVPEVVISAADGSTPDLVAGTDFTGFTVFGTGGSFDAAFTGDTSYGNTVSVTTGPGYGGGILAQFGIEGFAAGFASGYDELAFKIKGLVDDTILVKIEEPFPGASALVTIDLTAPPAGVTVEDLGDGWSQVVVSIANFNGGDVSTYSQVVFETVAGATTTDYTFYLADVGFNNAGGGTAMGGQVPEVVISAADGSTPDLVAGTDFTGFTVFGTGGSFDAAFTGDSSYGNTVSVTTGPGYGGGILAQFGIEGFAAGFASGYDELAFKIKGLVDNTILVKIEEPFPGASALVTIDLTAPPAGVTVEDLGDGWSQVVVSIANFNGGDVSTYSQVVFETVAGATTTDYTFYLADVGFNNAGGGTAMGGQVPEVVISAADGSTPDLVAGTDFTGFTAFGSGSTFDTAFTGDSSYGNTVSVTTGPGYGGGILAQFGIEGFAAGFASGYDELAFKIKGLVDNTILVKIEEPFPGASALVTIDLTAPPAGVTVEDLGDGWSQVVVSIANFNGGDVSTYSQVVFETVAGATTTDYTFYLADVGFNNAGGGGTGALVNGDFETGDLSGWTQTQVPMGVGSINADSSGQGGRAGTVARLVAAGSATPFQTNDVLISQEGLGAGTVSAGDSIDVTFDLFGTAAPGAAVFVEVIFLDGASQDVGRDFVSDASLPTPDTPYTPSGTWTSYSGTVVAGTTAGGMQVDVSGGVVLSLKVACGPVDGCNPDVSFDNVTLTIN